MQILFKCPTPDKTPRFAHFWQGAQSLAPATRNDMWTSNIRQFFTLLTSKRASRHNGAHFFDMSTSKSSPTQRCFVHFDLEMCFAQQCRALFHISTSKSAPTLVCFVHFDCLGHLCFAQSLIWPDGSAPAALASLLFDPPESQTIGKTQRFATLLPFCAPASSVLCLFLFSDLLSSSLLFSSLTLRTSAFSSVHNTVGSLTSKLPSTRQDLEIVAVSFSLHALTGASGELLRPLRLRSDYSGFLRNLETLAQPGMCRMCVRQLQSLGDKNGVSLKLWVRRDM